ncbi:phage tail terminator-like protein [Phyllobacterium sp. P5_D12]
MAATVEATIAEILFARLTSLVISPVLPVSYPGLAFTPPANAAYLKADFIPNRTDNLGLANDAKARHQGIIQVMAIYPVGQGVIKPTNTAGLVAAHFAKGTILYGSGVKLKVYAKPSVGAPMIEPDKVNVPVTILYRSFN